MIEVMAVVQKASAGTRPASRGLQAGTAMTVRRPKKDAPKRPVARNLRMAYCATVTLSDRWDAALKPLRKAVRAA